MEMTPRERWLAALRSQPVDRLPFWPKIDPAYLHRNGASIGAETVGDVHRFVGSDCHWWVAQPFCERRAQASAAPISA